VIASIFEIVADVLAALEPSSLITDEAFEILKSHPWSGNIRELKNVLTRMVIASSGRVISGAIAGSVLKKISGTEPLQPAIGATVQASLETLRSKAVLEAYHKFDGNISKTASYLSVSRNTVYRQLRNRPR